MKTRIPVDKILPILSDKFDLHFESIVKGAVLQRKLAETGLVMAEGEPNTIIAKISTIDVDRSGEVVIPEGLDSKDFMNNPIVCWAHDYSELPAAKITKLQITDTAVYAKIVFSSIHRAQEIYTLIKEGILNCCSVGFVATNALEKGTKAFNDFMEANRHRIPVEGVKRIITNWILLEDSIVSIPCNQAALITMRKLGISEDLIHRFEVKEGTMVPEVDEPKEVKPSTCSECGKEVCECKEEEPKEETAKEAKEETAKEAKVEDIITPEWLTTVKAELDLLDMSTEEIEVWDGNKGCLMGSLDEYTVYAMPFDPLMLKYTMDIVIAGNPMRYEWLPKDVIIVDEDFYITEDKHDLLHEVVECRLMKSGMTYDNAHDLANTYEKQYMVEQAEQAKAKEEVKEEIETPANGDSSPAEAFPGATTVTTPDKVMDEIISADVGHSNEVIEVKKEESNEEIMAKLGIKVVAKNIFDYRKRESDILHGKIWL